MKERYMLKIGEKYYGGRIGDIVMMSDEIESARVFTSKGELGKEMERIDDNIDIKGEKTTVIEIIK